MYNEGKNSYKTSILDRTTSIDDANLQKVNDVSQMAVEQLKRFDQNLTNEDPAEYYQKVKQEMTSTIEIDQPKSQNGVYELEIAETQLMPTISQKQEVEQTTAKISLNLRGKLIIAVYTSIILLLSVLLIYNAVSIAQYNAAIRSTSQEITLSQQELDALQQQLSQLMEQISPESAGMAQNGGIQVTANAFEKNTAVKYSVEKNWFDNLCEFFSSIFGG